MEFFTKKKQTLSFPFDDQQNTACFVCCHVLEGQPILYVSHDKDDGMWQFLGGSNHDMADARIFFLFEAYNIDNSIGLLKDMPRGYYAIRENVESDWIVKK